MKHLLYDNQNETIDPAKADSLSLHFLRLATMSVYLLSIGATLLLLLLVYQYIIFPSFVSPLSKIPNAHFTASCLPTWMWWNRRTGYETRSIFAAHQKYGPIVRLAPNELSVASLDGLRQIYTNGFTKHSWYLEEFSNFGLPNLVSMQEHKPHSVQKRMISHVYSKSYLQNSQDLNTLSRVLLFDRILPYFDSAAHDGTPVEVLEFFQAVSMDFMSAYLFGITNATDFIRDVKARQHYIRMYQTKLLRLPGAEVATRYLESHCLSMCDAAETFSQMPKVTADVLKTNPVVYSQLSYQRSKSPSSIALSTPDNLSIASEMFDHLLAARETSSVTLTYLMHELSRRPALQSALHSELLTLSPPVVHSYDSSGLPGPSAIDTLPLLNAIIYETLRRYAANPAPQPRLTPAGGTTIEGYANIPAGVRVSTAAYCLHRNAEVFPDPDTWKPERWLQGDQKKGGGTEEMRRWFWAFGSGGRMCIGSHFALQGTLAYLKSTLEVRC